MNKNIHLFIISLFTLLNFVNLNAQSIPSGFNYQAVVRNADGTLIKNRFIEVKFTIFNTEGNVFNEKYPINTNEFGLINLIVGTESEDYDNIDWSKGSYSLKVEINQGSGFEELGITTFQTVPYSSLAKDVINKDDADADPLNEIQTLTFNSETNELSISNGNSITIPVGGTDADADPLNEIQTISKSNDSIFLSKDGGYILDKVDDEDADSTNELQLLTINENELTISNGNTIKIPEAKSPWIENDSIVSRINGIVEIGNSKRNAKLSINNENNSYGIYSASTTEGTSVFGINRHKTGRTYGGKFTASSNEGTGVAGFNFSYSGKTKAGFFQANSTEGIGVVGKVVNASGRNIGVLGSTNSKDGYAGYFIGNVKVKGELKLGKVDDSSQKGTIRWNDETNDFEGFDGTTWKSLTKTERTTWGNPFSNESKSIPNLTGGEDDLFGSSISAGDNYFAVGAYGANADNHEDQGRVKIYKKHGIYWYQSGNLTAVDGKKGDFFGYSVSLDGDYVVVGAPGKNIGNNPDQGKAYVYHIENNNWILKAELTAFDGMSKSNFGISVSIDGDYIIVGAGNMDVEYSKQGKAYIYHREGDNWELQSSIVAPDAETKDYFGFSVSISGNNVVVGAYGKDVNDNIDQGKAYVFERDGTNWSFYSDLVLEFGQRNSLFGSSIDIDGNYVVIGCPNYVINGYLANAGIAYIYTKTGSTWHFQSTLKAYDPMNNNNFGRSVAINDNHVIIGASGNTINGNSEQGKAYVFKREGNDWNPDIILLASDGEESDYFGFSCSLSDNAAFIGAAGKTIRDNKYQGKVYIFSH